MADRHRWAACQAARRGPKIPGKGRARHKTRKKVTSRRQWFEDLARAVASPMGVEVAANRADGCCDRTGHNGVALCGTPAVSVVAAVWLPLLLLFLLPLLLLLLLLSYNYYCHHYHHDF